MREKKSERTKAATGTKKSKKAVRLRDLKAMRNVKGGKPMVLYGSAC